MRIPDSFKRAQADTFQDKSIDVLKTITVIDGFGGKHPGPGEEVTQTYDCNVQTVSDKMLAEEYGLVIGRDILITATSLGVASGSFIRYKDEVFRVLETPKFDAYDKLIAKKVSP